MKVIKAHLPLFHTFLSINGWTLCDKKLDWEFERWNKEDVFLIGKAKESDEFVGYSCSRKDCKEFENLVKMWNDFLKGVYKNEKTSEGME